MKKPALIIAIVVTVGAIITLSQVNTELKINKVNSMPKEYMKQVKITQFDINGNIKDNFTAKSWKFIANKNSSKIIEPVVDVFNDKSGHWQIKAKSALAKHKTNNIDDKIDFIEFHKDVLVNRFADSANQPIVIKTDNARFTPPTNQVTTDDFVTMQKPGFNISGKGMKGEFNTNSIEVQQDVKTTINAHG